MSARRIAAIALSGALIAGGTGAAIAAVTNDDASEQEQAILDDAAERLSVSPQKLRDALDAALDAQIDEAVRDGDLTQKQADAIKQWRKQSGRVLAGPLGGFPDLKAGPHLRGGHGFGPRGPRGPGGHRGAVFADLATALGITREQLRERLHDGKSVADIAKGEGKSLDDVRAAVKASVRTRLDKAVADGDLTRSQADRRLQRLDRLLQNLDKVLPRHRRGGPRLEPPGARPGIYLPPPQDGVLG